MRVAEREEEGMRVTERTSEIRWTKEMNDNRIRFFSFAFYLLSRARTRESFVFSLVLFVCGGEELF